MLRILEEKEIKDVYDNYMRKDFPKSELKPLSAIIVMLKKGIYDCLGYFEDGELKAYAFLVVDRNRRTGLLDYFAVCESCRGCGVGGKCLRAVGEYYQEMKGIVLECESVDSAQNQEEIQVRERRIRFYLGNGCIATRAKSRLFGVEYAIFYLPLGEREVDGAAELEGLYRLMFPEEVYDKYAKIFCLS